MPHGAHREKLYSDFLMLLRIRMYNNTYINYDKWLHGSMNEIDETDITKLQHDNHLVRVISKHISLFS